jgi:Cep192 domain 4/Beta-propeller repeat
MRAYSLCNHHPSLAFQASNSGYRRRLAFHFRTFGLAVLIAGGSTVHAQLPSFKQDLRGVGTNPKSSSLTAPSIRATYGKLPLNFEKNIGQTDARVKYLAHGQGYGLFLTSTEAVLALSGPPCKATSASRLIALSSQKAESLCGARGAAVRLQLIGANPDPSVSGEGSLPGKSNYFIGNDQSKWRTGVPNYAKVRYKNAYPGIDLVYYGSQCQLEFDMVVAPGADPHRLRFKLAGAKRIELSPEGNLVVHVRGGEVVLQKPVVYQEAVGGKKSIHGHYVLKGNREVAFEAGPYDKSRPLVVDPTLVYSTYVGGTGSDYGVAIAVDSTGDAYIGGNTTSTDFPTTTNPYQQSGATFVTKLNATGTALIYSTYFGQTSGSNEVEDLAIDSNGNVYLTGGGAGSGFPVVNQIASACDSNCQLGASAAFVTELNAAGSALVYSSRIGGAEGLAIAVDSSGNAYVAGETTSATDFPTVNAFQATSGGSSDAFLLKVNAAGSALDYSTFLGGSSSDQATGVAVDSSGNAYVAGTTESPNFPTKNQISGACVGACGNGTTYDVFVSKFNSTGSALVYSSLIGGSGYDVAAGGNPLYNPNYGHSLAVDASGNAYVGGITDGNPNDFPTTAGAFQTTANCAAACQDGFVTKINAAGNALSYSTFFGTTPSEVNGLAVDSSGDLAITGLFVVPFVNAFYQNGDAGIAVLNPAGSALLLSSSSGHGLGVTFDTAGNVYDAGYTCGNGLLATTGAFQTTCKSTSGVNAFAAKISLAGNAPAITLSPTSLTFTSQALGTTSQDQTINLSNTGSVALDITGITITGADSADFSQTNNCGTSVAANSSCLITVTFDPTATGSRTASVSIADNASGSPQTVSLTGTGVAATPIVMLAPAAGLSFGPQVLNTSSSAQNITLTNTGNAALSITGITITGANVGDYSQTNTCGASVAASAFCTISVIFKPTATGTRTALVSIADNASGSPQNASLSGTGVMAVPVVALSPTSLTFASQSIGIPSSAQAVTLKNTGNASLSISGITITGADAGDYSQTNTCGASVASGASCSISVTFDPTAAGTRLASVSIADNAPGNPQTVSLSGTAVATAPVVMLAPTSLTFTTQAIGSSSLGQTVMLSNTGNATLNISGITITGASAGDFSQTNTCGTTVAMSANCNINVIFAPTAVGTRTASLSIADNASGGQTVPLTGIATALPADFGLISSPGSATVLPGGPAIFEITVTPQNGFNSTVTFACSGLPSGYVCVFSPATVTPAGVAVTTALAIGEGGPASAAAHGLNAMFPGTALACVLCCFLGFRKRRLLPTLLLLAVTLTGLGITGCGTSPKGSMSTVTVTATSGSLQHTATVTITVK